MDIITYRHTVNSGDLIAAMAGIRQAWKITGKRAIIYQELNRIAEYYGGATHPIRDDDGKMVCMNWKQWQMLFPLLISQDYVAEAHEFTGQIINCDLNVIRGQTFCNMPYGPIQKWTWMAFPDLSCDLGEPWITVQPSGDFSDKIMINFTERYRNPNIQYFFLKDYESKILFAGTTEEHEMFSERWKLNIPRLIVNDFFELAQHLASCKLFLGNQSFCWNLAEAMKVPRILELSNIAPNCTSFGKNGYEFFHQMPVEYFVKKLYNNA